MWRASIQAVLFFCLVQYYYLFNVYIHINQSYLWFHMCQNLCIFIGFLVLWSICWSSSLSTSNKRSRLSYKGDNLGFYPLWWDFCYIVWFRVVCAFFWGTLLNFLVWWCPLPIFPSICKIPFPPSIQIFSWLVVLFLPSFAFFRFFLISMAHFLC